MAQKGPAATPGYAGTVNAVVRSGSVLDFIAVASCQLGDLLP
jgi:hypothetical protein